MTLEGGVREGWVVWRRTASLAIDDRHQRLRRADREGAQPRPGTGWRGIHTCLADTGPGGTGEAHRGWSWGRDLAEGPDRRRGGCIRGCQIGRASCRERV